jgi:hypothetical protein
MATKAQPQTEAEKKAAEEKKLAENADFEVDEKINEQIPLSSEKLWIVDLWEENRKVFSYLIPHIILTFIAIFILIKIHSLVEESSLPQHEKEILKIIDFYTIVVFLILFAFDFLYKMAVFIIRSIIKLHKEEN